jgi:hypothetical protein
MFSEMPETAFTLVEENRRRARSRATDRRKEKEKKEACFEAGLKKEGKEKWSHCKEDTNGEGIVRRSGALDTRA